MATLCVYILSLCWFMLHFFPNNPYQSVCFVFSNNANMGHISKQTRNIPHPPGFWILLSLISIHDTFNVVYLCIFFFFFLKSYIGTSIFSSRKMNICFLSQNNKRHRAIPQEKEVSKYPFISRTSHSSSCIVIEVTGTQACSLDQANFQSMRRTESEIQVHQKLPLKLACSGKAFPFQHYLFSKRNYLWGKYDTNYFFQ